MAHRTIATTLALTAASLLARPTFAATCSMSADRLLVALSGETGTLSIGSGGEIMLNGVQCPGAFVSTCAHISVTGSTSVERLSIKLGAGSAMAHDIDLGGGSDMLTIYGKSSSNHISLGSNGIDLDGDDTMDVAVANVETFVIRGGAANDSLSAAGGPATGSAFALPVSLFGHGGDDVLIGGNARDTLVGADGNDLMRGGAGNDLLRGGEGDDVEEGDDGNDSFDQGATNDGADVLSGGEGTDTVRYTGRSLALEVYLDDIANDGELWGEYDDVGSDIESVIGGFGDDFLVGSEAADILNGGPGEDALDGAGGADVLRGAAGGDVIWGGDGDDRIEGSDGNDSLFGDAGDDRLIGAAGDDWLEGGEGIDTLSCGLGLDYGLDDEGVAGDCE
jgi:Ca2+-binding RTX toxin-like protein